MAPIAVDAKEVRPVVAIHQVIGPVLAGQHITPGMVVEWDGNGYMKPAIAASAARAGIALSDSQVSGEQMTCLRKGIINLGATALDGAAIGAGVTFAAAGIMDTTAPGAANGTTVVPGFGSRPAAGATAVGDKLLEVDF